MGKGGVDRRELPRMDGGLGAEAELGRGAGFGAQPRLVGEVEKGRVDQRHPRRRGVDDKQPADDRERVPGRRAAQIRRQVGVNEGGGGQIRCAHQLGDRGDPGARLDERDHRRSGACLCEDGRDHGEHRGRLAFGHHYRIKTTGRPREGVKVPQPRGRGGRVHPNGLEHPGRRSGQPRDGVGPGNVLVAGGHRILEIDDQAVRTGGAGPVEPLWLRSGRIQPAARPRHPLCLMSHRTPLCAVPMTLQRPRDVIDRGRAR
jgi:hypothetical protein